MNDLTEPLKIPEDVRAAQYLANARTARDVALNEGVEVAFALQPYLHGKKVKTPLEQRIIELSPAAELITAEYPRMARGLAEIAEEENRAHFIDCSKVFDAEPHTTFADIWYFSDPAHEILARHLADGLSPILASMKARPAQASSPRQEK